MRFWAVALTALAVSIALNASAQPEDPGPSPSDIVVTGVRPEQVQAFVEQVTASPAAADQLGRWDDDLCASVVGLAAEQAQFIVDQISYRAQAVGLRAGRTGCDPNVFVFFAADAATFSQRLVQERPSLFAYYHEEHILTLGREALTEFTSSSRAIRWWHVLQTRGADGDRLGSEQAGQRSPPPPRGDEIRAGPDAITGVQAVRSTGSRVRAAERQDFNRVVVIVDGTRAAGYPLESLGDYIALVTLAQIDANAEIRDYPTILNMFNEGAEGSLTLTNWDQAYLDGLYRSTRNAASTNQQLREIGRRMTGDSGG
jgi:hypothetical protein